MKTTWCYVTNQPYIEMLVNSFMFLPEHFQT